MVWCGIVFLVPCDVVWCVAVLFGLVRGIVFDAWCCVAACHVALRCVVCCCVVLYCVVRFVLVWLGAIWVGLALGLVFVAWCCVALLIVVWCGDLMLVVLCDVWIGMLA